MTQRRTATQTRGLIFAACSDILRRDGLPHLTLDAVAEEAGLSKGGLLYHFPSKLALVEALFRHHLHLFDQRLLELESSERNNGSGSGRGSWLRAYALASIEQISDPETASLFASLFAAGERYPSVLEIMRESYNRWQVQIDRSGFNPSAALMIRLTVDGFWFTNMYQFAPPTDEHRADVINYILQLTREYA